MKTHHYKFGGPVSPLAKAWSVRAHCGINVLYTHTTETANKVTCMNCVRSYNAACGRMLKQLGGRKIREWTNE